MTHLVVFGINLAAGLAWAAVGFGIALLLGLVLQSGLADDDPLRAVIGVAALVVGVVVAGTGMVATFRVTRRFRRPSQGGATTLQAVTGAPPWALPSRFPTAGLTTPAAAPPGARTSADAPRLGEGLTGQIAPPEAPGQRRPAAGRWLAAIGAVVAAGTALAAGIFGTILLGMETEGYAVLLSAPVGGFVVGIAAGAIAGWRQVIALGFVVAVAGFTAGILVAFATWPGVLDEIGSGGLFWLAFLVAITGIPALAGFGFAAAWTLPHESLLRRLLEVLLPR